MSAHHKQVLSAKRLELCRSLCLDEVVQFLVQESVLSDNMVETIMSKQTRFSRNIAFLTLLPTRGRRAYAAFKQSLYETCQSHLASMLDESEKKCELAELANIPINSVCRVEIKESHSTASSRDCATNKNSEDEQQIRTASSIFPTPTERHDGGSKLFVEATTLDFYKRTHLTAYKMTSRSRGMALVIDVNEFHDKTVFPGRRGSEVDRRNIVKLLEQLTFKVKVSENVSARTMKAIIHSFAQNTEHNHSDCCAVVIMSHGHEKQIYGCDGIAVDIEEIFCMFDNVNCPMLRQKPKLFLIQACRDLHKIEDCAHEFPSAAERQVRSPMTLSTSVDTPVAQTVDELVDRLPTTSDMIIGYASMPGL